jgi:hypothetical protein
MARMESELGNPDWIDIARSFISSVGVASPDDALRLLAPDATYRVLGHHALAGAFSGRDAIAGHLAALITQTDGRFDPVKYVDWMLGLRHVSMLVDVHVEVGRAGLLLRHLILMAFNADDLIEEVTVFSSDPDVAERLYGHLLRDASTKDR